MTSSAGTAHPSRPARRRFAWLRLLVAAGCAATTAVAVFAVAGQAGANPPGPHDTEGAVQSVAAVSGQSAVAFTGWAADPDALTKNATVAGIVDGHYRNHTITSVASPAIRKAHHTGPTPGFKLTVPYPADGHTHIVCVDAAGAGPGLSTLLRCVAAPLGTRLTSAQVAARSPIGKITARYTTSSSLRVVGYSTDPDYLSRHQVVVLYVDGYSAATVTTHHGSVPAGAGPYSAFDITVPVSSGSHIGCVWAVNVGFGSNSFLGCVAADTRGPAGTGKVPHPAANKTVVATAKKMIGGTYIWGAENPKKRQFDCSGLTQYSYSKAKITIPRVAQDQFHAARLIYAARAVPGDLVFYHDTEGAVYHVGVYTGPGMTIAAIDQQEGIQPQPIWDPTFATYGAFTHR